MSIDPLDQTGVMHLLPDLTADLSRQQSLRPIPSSAAWPDIGPRYRLVQKLGEGGMGSVYRGVDEQSGRAVAVKLLSVTSTLGDASSRRFLKEARMLAQVQHAHVANLLDFGEHNGLRFLVLELVDGLDLREALRRQGTLSERQALSLIRDIADALAAAHAQGIVHRDLKPGNILLSAEAETGESAVDAVYRALANDTPVCARLTDFGLARHVDQTASLELTKTGALLGTPYYIAPEQCSERGQVTPASDVYSLGATLFELLTGRPPFLSDDPVKLITAHCFEPAPALRKLQPELSDAVAELVARMLQKSPQQRPADGSQVRDAIDRILIGDLSTAPIHPVTSPATRRMFEANWEWELSSSPEALWPYISHTDRLNAAVGIPPVQYEYVRDAERGLRLFGTIRLGLAKMRWEKLPFEWIEGRRVGILREFVNGPFAWFLNTVELEPLPTGGTRLRHTVRIAARGWLGQILAYIEAQVKGRKPLDRVYRRIDDVLTGRYGSAPTLDHFEDRAKLTSAQRQRLDRAAAHLRTSPTLDPVAVEALVNFLAESPPQELARIRPLALATRLGVSSQSLVQCCLQACQAGLLELHWDILCPTCRVAANVTATLAEIGQHQNCQACDLGFEVDFARSIELIFRVHPDIRAADLKTYCIGGPAQAPHVVAQTRLQPGETLPLDLQLDAGVYLLRGPQLPYTIRFSVQADQGVSTQSLSFRPGQQSGQARACRAGRQVLSLTNHHPQPLVLRLERTVPRKDCLTAVDAARIPEFRQLFPTEMVSRERLSSLTTYTLLALRVTNVLEMFAEVGESGTSDRLWRTLASCRQTLELLGGNIVQETDDQLVAAFPRSQIAAEAAVRVLEQNNQESCQQHPTDRPSSSPVEPRLRASLTRGTATSTTWNGQLDIHGRTVSQAGQSLNAAGSESLVISTELGADSELRSALEAAGWFPSVSSKSHDQGYGCWMRFGPSDNESTRQLSIDISPAVPHPSRDHFAVESSR